MGVDFLRNKRLPHKKAWNAQMLGRALDLFAADQNRSSRVVRATLQHDAALATGCEVLIRRLPSGEVVVSKDIRLIGCFVSPPADLIQSLEAHDQLLAGRVYQCFEDLGFFDIELEV